VEKVKSVFHPQLFVIARTRIVVQTWTQRLVISLEGPQKSPEIARDRQIHTNIPRKSYIELVFMIFVVYLCRFGDIWRHMDYI
jgi:hypothetical protein